MKRILLSFFITLLLCAASAAQNRTRVHLEPIGNEVLKARVEANASQGLTAFNVAFVERGLPVLPDSVLTDRGRAAIEALWDTAPFRCPEIRIDARLVQRPDQGYEIREVPLLTGGGDGSMHREEGVLLLTPSGLIDGLYFGLKAQRYWDLVSQGDTSVEFRQRQVMLDFVENFRTAYNRKDLPFFQDVFSDNALIIVGHVVQVQPGSSGYLEGLPAERIEYIRRTKAQYLGKLRQVFAKNEFINVGFEEIEIYQHPEIEEIYGVTTQQHWVSPSYSDSGYVFLMIEFEDETRPTIHVRAWQPEHPQTRVISLGDFNIIRNQQQ